MVLFLFSGVIMRLDRKALRLTHCGEDQPSAFRVNYLIKCLSTVDGYSNIIGYTHYFGTTSSFKGDILRLKRAKRMFVFLRSGRYFPHSGPRFKS